MNGFVETAVTVGEAASACPPAATSVIAAKPAIRIRRSSPIMPRSFGTPEMHCEQAPVAAAAIRAMAMLKMARQAEANQPAAGLPESSLPAEFPPQAEPVTAP